MVNAHWINAFPCSEVVFLPELSFDHSPILVTIYEDRFCGRKPFRYFNMWKKAIEYDKVVTKAWEEVITGTKMYCIVQKLKRVKLVLKSINQTGFTDSQKTMLSTREALAELQAKLNKEPQDVELMNQEQELRNKFTEVSKVFLVSWHKKLRIQNRIFSIEDEYGNWCDTPKKVQHAFLDYYQKLLGSTISARRKVVQEIVDLGPKVTSIHNDILLAEYTRKEVEDTIFAIDRDKAPGPDEYGSTFFQENWKLVGDEVVEAVLSFLKSRKFLKEINTTTITLIPKSKCPKSVVDFRPISCCNVIYKTATKVLCNRLRGILPDLIAANQGGFTHGRFIAHKVLVCQDLVRLYRRKNCKPSCMIKINLRKAYDTIEWGFIEEMMKALGFPSKFIALILECICTPKFSLLLNGSMCGFFNTKRGLRQGDPMSPLLFVLGMEYLSRIFTKVGEWPGFKFHDKCGQIKLNHLCFADDLLVFCNGDFISIMLLLKGLKLFSSTSGLMPNDQKIAIYCSGMSEFEVNRILEASNFKRSSLPFRYLGVPICSRKISREECQCLLEKMTSRIRPKSTGGLGLRNIQQWNVAALGRWGTIPSIWFGCVRGDESSDVVEIIGRRGNALHAEGFPPRIESISVRRRGLDNIGKGFGKMGQDLMDAIIWEVVVEEGDILITIREEQVRDMDKVIWQGDGEKMTVGDPVILKNVSSDSITNFPIETSFEERFPPMQDLPNIRGGVSQRGVQKGGPDLKRVARREEWGSTSNLETKSIFREFRLLKNGGEALRAKEEEENSFHFVKGLSHVQLHRHPINPSLLPIFDGVENFFGHKNIVRNETTFAESTLSR
uniref:Reverse transcriptase domain-containing protein n=1 Tax=Cannabis sativa TaxID=3483 RepID=A0A803Q963_CANSA